MAKKYTVPLDAYLNVVSLNDVVDIEEDGERVLVTQILEIEQSYDTKITFIGVPL